jgi:hypothetical protein
MAVGALGSEINYLQPDSLYALTYCWGTCAIILHLLEAFYTLVTYQLLFLLPARSLEEFWKNESKV